MATYALAVYPVPNRFINVGKEAQPGSIAAGTYTFPLTTFKPVDKYTRLEDNAWRNAMAQLYNLIDGVRISDVSLGGPFFADGIGYPLMDISATTGRASSAASRHALVAGGQQRSRRRDDRRGQRDRHDLGPHHLHRRHGHHGRGGPLGHQRAPAAR